MRLLTINAGLRQRCAGLLDAVLHKRGKRIVFLASLAASVGPTTSFTKETRVKLNRVMHLAKGDSALVFPFELSKVIWHGKSGVEIFHFDPTANPLTTDMIEQMAHNAVMTMPRWLQYGDFSEIAQDVGRLLRSRHEVFGF